MLANIIIIAVVGILFVLCIRKQVVDHKKGIPSCGLNCGNCTSDASCSCDNADVPERLRAKKK